MKTERILALALANVATVWAYDRSDVYERLLHADDFNKSVHVLQVDPRSLVGTDLFMNGKHYGTLDSLEDAQNLWNFQKRAEDLNDLDIEHLLEAFSEDVDEGELDDEDAQFTPSKTVNATEPVATMVRRGASNPEQFSARRVAYHKAKRSLEAEQGALRAKLEARRPPKKPTLKKPTPKKPTPKMPAPKKKPAPKKLATKKPAPKKKPGPNYFKMGQAIAAKKTKDQAAYKIGINIAEQKTKDQYYYKQGIDLAKAQGVYDKFVAVARLKLLGLAIEASVHRQNVDCVHYIDNSKPCCSYYEYIGINWCSEPQAGPLYGTSNFLQSKTFFHFMFTHWPPNKMNDAAKGALNALRIQWYKDYPGTSCQKDMVWGVRNCNNHPYNEKEAQHDKGEAVNPANGKTTIRPIHGHPLAGGMVP